MAMVSSAGKNMSAMTVGQNRKQAAIGNGPTGHRCIYFPLRITSHWKRPLAIEKSWIDLGEKRHVKKH